MARWHVVLLPKCSAHVVGGDHVGVGVKRRRPHGGEDVVAGAFTRDVQTVGMQVGGLKVLRKNRGERE